VNIKLSGPKILLLTGGVLFIAASSYSGYLYWKLYQEEVRLNEQISGLQSSVAALETSLSDSKNETARTALDLQKEQDENASLRNQIKDLSGTVSTLNKLVSTDPELLKKYSKVYFLSENYIPLRFTQVEEYYLYDKNKPQEVHIGIAPFFKVMLNSAEQAGIPIKVVSAYRSFEEQNSLKTGYKFSYGSGANQFSADQGYSEHQLGTTLDLTTPESSGLSLSFEKTAAYDWLTANAHRFGFVLSYPRGNSYYQFEPWHWRFVGVNLATKIHNEDRYFYELDQREIDEYLISIFD
jgi:zinc D-Ala-D-Ala carboxypeptidase